jgi:REP element-mobilizing transposase RayT
MAIPLEPEKFYHIFNRANGSELVFSTSENYRFFLKKYTLYISPIAETYCYCLMPNHFHFLIKIKELSELNTLDKFNPKYTHASFLSKQFSNLFSCYTQAYNKINNRKGSLFMRPFKRIEITSEDYLRTLIKYIHLNPVDATLCNVPEKWEFSSYSAIISSKSTSLYKTEVINYFDTLENFKFFHHQ